MANSKILAKNSADIRQITKVSKIISSSTNSCLAALQNKNKNSKKPKNKKKLIVGSAKFPIVRFAGIIKIFEIYIITMVNLSCSRAAIMVSCNS